MPRWPRHGLSNLPSDMLRLASRPRSILCLWDTHPVQYRAPLYSAFAGQTEGLVRVFYESDHSMHGYRDIQFGRNIAWDLPLMDGYTSTILPRLGNWPTSVLFLIRFTHAAQVFLRMEPSACLVVHLDTAATAAAYCAACLLGVPQWLRVETQDQANERGTVKNMARSAVYRMLYACFARAFFIGELNRQHLLRHGFQSSQLRPARYGVIAGVREWSAERKSAERLRLRHALGIPAHALVVGFCGKLIPKKNPALLLEAHAQIESAVRRDCHLLFIGSGELEGELRERARPLGGRAHFTGFINQVALPAYYLAMDVFVLPSWRQGETWGLVVNEALHAGCAVAMSEAVGCSADFGFWERCRVFSPGGVAGCAAAVNELAAYPRDFEWCAGQLATYSLEAAARSLGEELRALDCRALVI